MNYSRKLMENTMIYAIGNFSSRAIGFLLLPLYTYQLNASEYGYYDLIIVSISLMLPLVIMQLPEGMYRFVLEGNGGNDEIISNAFFLVVRNIVIFNLVYIFVEIIFPFELAILIQIYFNVVIMLRFFQQLARAKKATKLYSLTGLLTSVIILISNLILLLIFGLKVEALLISNIIANICAIILIEVNLKIFKCIKFSSVTSESKKKLLKFSLPLIPTSIIWWVMNVSDRYFITYYLGQSSNGIYAIANKIPAILIIIYGFYNLAWQDVAISSIKNEDINKSYSEIFKKIFSLVLSTLIVFISFSNMIFKMAFSSEYLEAVYILPYLLYGAAFYCFSAFYGIGFRTSNQTSGEMSSSIIGALINVIINFIAIPLFGIKAAAISTMLSFLIVWITRILMTKKYYTITLNKKIIIYYIIVLVTNFMLFISKNNVLQIINILLAIIVFYNANKNWLYRILINQKTEKEL